MLELSAEQGNKFLSNAHPSASTALQSDRTLPELRRAQLRMAQQSGDAVPAGDRASDGWKERIVVPTALAGLVGGGFGMVSKNRRAASLSYAANFAVVAGCYCGARELARDAMCADKDDLMNSVVGGFASGAVLGRLQGGQLGAVKYAVLFAAGGTLIDFLSLELRPHMQRLRENFTEENMRSWLTLPEWSPIQIMDEEALAKKQARDKQLIAQRASLGKLNKEES